MRGIDCGMRIATVTLLLFAVGAPARAAELSKLAVLPLVPKKVDPATVGILDELLVNEVDGLREYLVIGTEDINAMLGLDRMKQALGCDDVTCAADIGGALGAAYLLTGSVSVLGNEAIVSLRLIDIDTHVVRSRAQVSTRNDERAFKDAVRQAVAKLFGRPAPAAAQPVPPATAAKGTPSSSPAAVPPTSPAAVPPTSPAALTRASAVPLAPLRIATGNRDERFATTLRASDGQEHACSVAFLQPCDLWVPQGPALLSVRLTDRDLDLADELRINQRGARLQLSHRNFSKPRLIAGLLGLAGSGVTLLLFRREPTNKGSDTADDFGWEPKKQVFFVSSLVLATVGVILATSALAGEQLVVDQDDSATGELAAGQASFPGPLGI